jgi:hypothetical protein
MTGHQSAKATSLISAWLVLSPSACGERSLSAGSDASSDTSGTADAGDPSQLLSCEGPNAPSEAVELVGGEMQPATFVRVGERIYWADAWDRWADEPPSTTLYRTDAATDGPWISVADEQPGINQIVSDGESIYWVVEGLSQASGELLRAGLDDEIEILDSGLLQASALTLGDANQWVYYAERGNWGELDAKLLRVRPDGSSKQEIVQTLGEITDIEVDETHVWWVAPTNDGVWRVGKDGSGQELVAETYSPEQIEVHDGLAWTISLSGLYRIEVGEEPYFVAGLSGPYELAADASHVYLPRWNSFEDQHLGWVERYPLMEGEFDIFDHEWVTEKVSPKPTAVRVDEHAIYWSTADEESGQGAIWMLCKSAL